MSMPSITWQPTCPLCASTQNTSLGPNPDFPETTIRRCRACSMMWTAPVPSEATLDQIYRMHYRASYQGQFPPEYFKYKDLRAQAQCDFIAQYTTVFKQQNLCALDIGCAAGSLLATFTQAQPTAQLVGFEPDPDMLAAARERLPRSAQLYGELFTPTRVQPQCFDLIAASHLLEHVPDMRAFLSGLADLTNPHGILFLEVPYETPASVREQSRAHHRGLIHLLFFNPQTLAQALRQTGWQVQHIGMFGPHRSHFSVVPPEQSVGLRRLKYQGARTLAQVTRQKFSPRAEIDWGKEYRRETPAHGIWIRAVGVKHAH